MSRISFHIRGSVRAFDSLVSVAIGITIIFGLVPIGLYEAVLGRTPTIQAVNALAMIENTDEDVILIDVRQVSAYQERHISGAISLPLENILNIDVANDLPQPLQGKTLLMVCDSGILSAQAARHLRKLGMMAYSIRGGIQDWGRAWPEFADYPSSQFELAGGNMQVLYRAMSPGEQAAAALALLWVKPTYMLLSAVVAFVLLCRKAVDLRILGWGLLVFLIGEVFCAINYILLKDNSYFAEYVHSLSMALAFGLTAYALMEGLDERLVHFSQADKHCAMLPVCGPCVKYQAVRCGIRRIAQFSSIALIVLAIIPLLSLFSYTAYNTRIGPVYHYYVRPVVHQWFEARYSPSVAIILVILALLIMFLTPRVSIHPLARVLFCGGFGFIGFALFRVMLGMIYAEALIWATFWEELTELMFVVAVIYLLWVFRHTVLPNFNILEVMGKKFMK